ncbi:Eco57I restriction-modification methylase domain-containing protein [Microtetraspora malaysiensis]|uniref:Eco57I restriction-modification methylase domain-containing protein n=1 Tax=Microtetraspora malaysiensis TaxID=161358 RepID=UPI003D91071B
MKRRRRTSGGVSEEIRRRHAWLELLQTSGPFLALPVVHRVFPNGLPGVSKMHRAEMRLLVEEMLSTNGGTRHKVIETMLRDVLDWQQHLLIDTEVPAHLSEQLAGLSSPIGPDFAFHVNASSDDDEESDEDEDEAAEGEDIEGVSDALGGEWRLLGLYMPWGTHPLARIPGAGAVTHIDRLASLLRARQVPIGVVTDGRWWAIVWAPVGGTTGVAIWDADSFSGESQFFDALVALLSRFRFLSVTDDDTLPRLLRESLNRQEEVTERLGEQVRDAVEMLVTKLDQLDRDQGGKLLKDVSDEEFYSGVVTFMMRLVFLLFAEERRLLPSDDTTYVESYSVGHLVKQLETRAQLAGMQSLAHRTAAWHRLLAVSRAVYSGIAHENLRLPAYGGEMFDPDAYPWLEGRLADDPVAMATPPAVDDLTVWHILDAVQFVKLDGERRRLTFRALDVEQIGYVYEGLLELEVQTANEITLSLPRPAKWPRVKKAEVKEETCEVALSEVLKQRDELDEKEFATWLSGYTSWKADKVVAELSAPVNADQRTELERVVGTGPECAAIEPLLRVIRVAETGQPVVTLPQGRYVTRSSRRASSGTHYTPRRLAEEIVRHALDPLVHRPGPLETGDETQWRIRPSSEIRDLKVADIAMGSGAFLVAACRYLAEKMVNAWEEEGRQDAIIAAQQRAGQRVASDSDVDAVLLEARQIIAEHCLYGVDINPLAVSMAKLSLWLITMDRERPFGFLDDRLVAGDTLLGLTSLNQLATLHIDPEAGRKLHKGTLDFANQWRGQLERAADLRRKITAAPAITIRDIEHKAILLQDATKLGTSLATVADALTGRGLATANVKDKKKQDAAFVNFALIVSANEHELEKLSSEADRSVQEGLPEGALPRMPLHWPLTFPEVFADEDRPGFDAIIGNPPFVGGKKISGSMGDNYLAWLQRWDGNAVTGSTDLAARFVLRAEKLLNHRGQLGLVTTKTVAEGAPLKVGLEQVVQRLHLWRARSPHPWPTNSASLQIVEFWASRIKPGREARLLIDGEAVPSIGPDLQVIGTIPGRPHPLERNQDSAFIGSYVLGLGFTLTDEERGELIARDPRNDQLIHPYANGRDINQRPRSDASRWVINFRDWPLEMAEQYPDLIDIVRRLVKPERDKKKGEDYRRYWWRFARRSATLNEISGKLHHVLALSRVGNTLMPARVPAGRTVFSEATVIFALDDFGSLAFLSSSAHVSWVIRWTSTMRTDIRYAPTDVFATLPRPEASTTLESLGKELHQKRQNAILACGWKGLTDTYNKVNNATVRDAAVQELRDIHAEIDREVLRAYGWADIEPNIGFHRTKIGVRWMVDADARFEIVDRLRILNEERFKAQR